MGAAAAIAALSSVLQGRQQGQAESDVYKQQLQQRQLEQQAQSQKLMMELQGYQRAEKARSGLSPQDQQTIDLGGSIGDIQKRTDLTSRAKTVADQLVGMANETGRTPDQKIALYRMALNLQQNPASVADIEKLLGSEGIGKSSGTGRPFELVDRDSGSPVFYSGTGPVPPNAVPASVYALEHKPPKETPTDKALASPVGATKGLNIVTPSGDPWPTPLDTYGDAIKKGGVPLSDKGKEALDLNIAADQELTNILEAAKGVLPDATGRLANALNPLKLGGERALGMPDVAAFDAAKISLITHLRAVANASRVNQQELNQVNAALSHANSYPALAAAVEQARKQLQVSRKYLVKAGKLDLPTANASRPPRKPLLDASGHPLGTKDGRPLYVGDDGKKYTEP